MDWLTLQRIVNNENYTQLNRRNKQEKVYTGTCGWCGAEFVKKANKTKYCSDYCRESARSHQSRMKSHRWYHRHKHELTEKQRWGLGSGTIGQHRHKDYKKEQKVIQKEIQRLGIRRKTIKK